SWVQHRVPLNAYVGRRLRLRFIADAGPRDNSTTDQGMWGDVYVIVASEADRPPVPRSENSMTWVGKQPFTSRFAFWNIEAEKVDLTFRFEGSAPVYLRRVSARAATDLAYREFENGLVIANPSPHEVTVNMEERFPGRSYRRLLGSSNQDPVTNNGQPIGNRLQLSARDALFLVREAN
ncbi:MAG: hypothetical protein JJ992_20190, partial [Planctomycetes bacterium]|nr:hypothetical protein [Planctomycetota bacterium]